MNRTITHSFRDGVKVSYHEHKGSADKAADVASRQQNKVARDVTYFKDPKTGERGRLHVVTVRPPERWEKHARIDGFGIR